MDNKMLSAKDSALSFVLGFTFSQIAVMVFTLLGSAIAGCLGMDLTTFQNFLNTALGYFLMMLVLDFTLAFIFLCFNLGKQNNIVARPNFLKCLLYICLAIICFFMLYPIISCVDSIFIKFGAKLNDLPYKLTHETYTLSILSMALMPAICEELLFRGLIFKGLKKFGKAFSIFLSALMFALFHMSYQQLLYPFLMGLFLAVIMYYENNIIYTILAHFINNFFSLTISYYKINLIFNHWSYILLAIVLLLAFMFAICYFVFRNKSQAIKEQMPKNQQKYLTLSLAIMSFLWIIINVFNK